MKTVICLLAVVAFAAGAQMVDPFGECRKKIWGAKAPTKSQKKLFRKNQKINLSVKIVLKFCLSLSKFFKNLLNLGNFSKIC